MRERLACGQCEEVICADLENGKRIIGTPKDGQRFVVFPQNVEDCPMRVPENERTDIVGQA
jgi:hypothetical protein